MPSRRRFLKQSAAAVSGVVRLSSASVTDRRASGGGFTGNGCVGHVASPGISLCGTGPSSTG